MNYKKSRNTAWQILIKNKISSMPVRVSQICKSEHIRLYTYKEGEKIIRHLRLENNIIGNDAFSIGRVIFYDDSKPSARQRFSVAHEIGHIILHKPDCATVYNREISQSDDPKETEANVFASRLLAPLCVLHFLNVQSAKQIAEICDISMTAAQIRFTRLCEIRIRDREMRRTTGHGCFLISHLERQVYSNFFDYIEKNRL